MAIGATVYNFDVQFSDTDRHVYQQISLRPACHPSETVEFMLCRVLAFCLEYEEGLEFSKGLEDPEQPAIWRRDLSGQLASWIEVGAPSPEKLHKASKAVGSGKIAVYTHRNAQPILEELRAANIYKAEDIPFFAVLPAFLKEVSEITERRNNWQLVQSEGELYLETGGKNITTQLVKYSLGSE